MSMETLRCKTCNNDFERERVRGRKPKQCPPCKSGGTVPRVAPSTPKRDIILKHADGDIEYHGPQVIDPATGKRDPGTVRGDIEVEIPDEATESSPTPFLLMYDQMLIDGKLYKQGDIVKISKDAANNCRYKIREFVIPKGDLPMYVGLVGCAGIYDGKWRTVDPWRIHR